jgi:signal peptidase II
VFQVIVGTGLIALLIWLLRAHARSPLFVIALGLILAGGGSNLIDRLLHHGRVIDFMNLGIGPLRTGIFNFADVFITVGGVVLAWLSYRQEHPVKQTETF